MRLAFTVLLTTAQANRNAVGQLPIMGWSGYNALMQNNKHCLGAAGYNETTFIQTADVLIKTGLRDLGYTYLNLDDCWIAENRTADGELTWDTSRFSKGIPWLAEQAHSRGLKLGLYASASKVTCRNFPGSQGYEELDAKTYAAWGADFVKLDSCGGTLAHGSESWQSQYTRWAAAMNATGRQMVFSCSWPCYYTICAQAYPMAEWEDKCGRIPWDDNILSDTCHMWRYGNDLYPFWGDGAYAPITTRVLSGQGKAGIGDIIEFASSVVAYNTRSVTGPGAYNDPDFLVVGCPTDKKCDAHPSPPLGTSSTINKDDKPPPPSGPPLSDIEQRTQFSMWCILAAPLILGSDIRNLSTTALATLSNREAIAINQDSAALPPRLIVKRSAPAAKEPYQVWARELHNGDVAIAMINTGNVTSIDITVQLVDVVCTSCKREAMVTDVWAGDQTIGSRGPPAPIDVTDSYTAKGVRPHETVLLRLAPK